MKNILFIHGGAELYGADIILLQLLKSLNKKEYKAYVLLPNHGPLVKEIQDIGVEVEVKEYPILRRKFFTPMGIIKYGIGFSKSIFKLKKYIKEKDIDIIQSNTVAVLEGAVLHSITKKPHIWHVHEIIKEPKFLNDFYKKFLPKHATKIVCVSEAVKENLLTENKKYEEKFKVIHNGIDSLKFTAYENNKIREELNLTKDEIIIGTIGRVNKIKGQGFLLDVAKKVIKKHDNVSFYLVGSAFEGQENLMEELVEKSKDEELKGRVYISEFRSDIADIYNNLDIFVLSSIKPDSFPTVVLESMSTGIPVVANVTGGVNEMIEDGKDGFLIHDISVDNMANKLEKLIEDENLRKTFAREGISKIKTRFTTESFISKFESLYTTI
ncbi:MAG: glycosyltransferase family 4 protein [Clostridium sp.]